MFDHKDDTLPSPKPYDLSAQVPLSQLTAAVKNNFNLHLAGTILIRCRDYKMGDRAIHDTDSIKKEISSLQSKKNLSLQDKALLCILYYSEASDASAKALLDLLPMKKINEIMNPDLMSDVVEAKSDVDALLVMIEIVGRMHIRGLGFEKDEKRAIEYVKKAAKQGYAVAQQTLAICYDKGAGTEQDVMKWCQEAANQGHPLAQFTLAKWYRYGDHVEQNTETALKWYRSSAEQGHADAQLLLAKYYESGDGIKKDLVIAMQWYHKAAEQGFVDAQFELATSYLMQNNKNEAMKWFTKAAEQGNVEAQYQIGNLYNFLFSREGEIEAVKWYRKAAERGHILAQAELGSFLEKGLGTVKDEKEAAKWYLHAAEQKYEKAQFLLAVCYCEGRGVNKNFSEAAKWFREAYTNASANNSSVIQTEVKDYVTQFLKNKNGSESELLELSFHTAIPSWKEQKDFKTSKKIVKKSLHDEKMQWNFFRLAYKELVPDKGPIPFYTLLDQNSKKVYQDFFVALHLLQRWENPKRTAAFPASVARYVISFFVNPAIVKRMQKSYDESYAPKITARKAIQHATHDKTANQSNKRRKR